MNKQLIKAGLCYLIDKDKDTFLDRMSIYLRDKSKLMDFLFDGPLPINDKIEKKIEEYIKKDIPCNDYFDKIVKIEIDFDYDLSQLYLVTYNVTRFYNQDKQPYNGLATEDDDHKIPAITKFTIYINPEKIQI